MEDMELTDINLFWADFTAIEGELRADPENKDLIDKIDLMVKKLGSYDWEYGPFEDHFYFCISPHFDKELIPSIEEIMNYAPSSNYWEFMVGKPRKKELLSRFVIYDSDNREVVVDTDGWECIIYRFEDGTYDLDVKMNIKLESEDMKYLALDIHLTNILGEKVYLSIIEGIDIVDEFDDEVKNRAVRFNEIAKYIKRSDMIRH
ncbi:hypothetical protein GCM10009122_42220 [Fulvivirga kasyanovii]|uniref:DUF695 domain-containing protein n=1 Tax=Fulvivirga kasyanovii TaxID=396812 RepID=A0ABW9RIK7_9BACT|nr:hypothetical protein [Fulvivirga kasyanovii]MTI23742.1 hypothetical protein [Fulvivirga kasyanovii]